MKIKLIPKFFTLTFMLAFSFMFTIFANAEENKPVTRADDTATSSVVTNDSSNISEDSKVEQEIDKALVGNANLIKEKKIIHDSSEMQFIAVTTKDEQVFYILIDYTATNDNKSGEGAVYFLNKVDSADLFAIANANSDDTTPELEYNDSLANKQAATESISDSNTNDKPADEVQPQKSNDAVFYIFLLIAAAVIITVIYFIKIKPKKNAIKDDDDEDDDFEMDDYEINEDEETET